MGSSARLEDSALLSTVTDQLGQSPNRHFPSIITETLTENQCLYEMKEKIRVHSIHLLPGLVPKVISVDLAPESNSPSSTSFDTNPRSSPR